jgi:hypothetical protein
MAREMREGLGEGGGDSPLEKESCRVGIQVLKIQVASEESEMTWRHQIFGKEHWHRLWSGCGCGFGSGRKLRSATRELHLPVPLSVPLLQILGRLRKIACPLTKRNGAKMEALPVAVQLPSASPTAHARSSGEAHPSAPRSPTPHRPGEQAGAPRRSSAPRPCARGSSNNGLFLADCRWQCPAEG